MVSFCSKIILMFKCTYRNDCLLRRKENGRNEVDNELKRDICDTLECIFNSKLIYFASKRERDFIQKLLKMIKFVH